MSAIVEFNNLSLEVLEYQDTWALSDKQVAQGFGVTQNAVKQQRCKGATEYREGVHYYYKDMYHDGKGNLTDTPVSNPHGGQNTQKMVFWTKKGVVTLGFKLTETPQTIAFRDWASDYILAGQARPVTIQDILADPRGIAELMLKYADEQDKNKQLEAQITADMPYTNFGKVAEFSGGSLLIRDFAKILASEGIDIGEKRLYRWFREQKYIMPHSTEPYHKYIEAGYFERKPAFVNRPNIEFEAMTTKITPKGQVYFTQKLIEFFKKSA